MSEHLRIVADLIREVLGDDLDPSQEIAPHTAFAEDLELESIEFVALAEKIQAHYGERVDFVSWLSSMELDAVLRLTVGDLVEHIDRCLSSTSTD